MALKRRQPPPPAPEPHPCDCRERVDELEATLAAVIAALITLRPRLRQHSVARGLAAWGVDPDDALRIERAYLQRRG